MYEIGKPLNQYLQRSNLFITATFVYRENDQHNTFLNIHTLTHTSTCSTSFPRSSLAATSSFSHTHASTSSHSLVNWWSWRASIRAWFRAAESCTRSSTISPPTPVELKYSGFLLVICIVPTQLRNPSSFKASMHTFVYQFLIGYCLSAGSLPPTTLTFLHQLGIAHLFLCYRDTVEMCPFNQSLTLSCQLLHSTFVAFNLGLHSLVFLKECQCAVLVGPILFVSYHGNTIIDPGLSFVSSSIVL